MNTLTIHAALCVVGLGLVSPANSAELALPKDGWTSWQVDAVEGAPDWCCWNNWKGGDASRTECLLDDDRHGYGSRDKSTTDSVRVYARMAGGKIERLRAFSASCPVKAKTEIRELGDVATDDSAHLLIGLVKQFGTESAKGEVGEHALNALALHRGEPAEAALVTFARSDAHVETRKKAVFWLAILRGTKGAEVATSVMFNDPDAELRRHGAFAITQSKSPRVTADLIRLGNTDKDGGVRAQAWFWLAQTGAAESEAALVAALKKDTDAHVREQAVFAMSQLPDERAVRALISVAEDRSLTKEQRKRAVFWLTQSDAEGAQKYMEKVLVGKGGD